MEHPGFSDVRQSFSTADQTNSAAIWSIVKGLLDPVVANKIRFANSESELAQFLPRTEILKELGGGSSWQYEYIEPRAEENCKLKDAETREILLAHRAEIVSRFESITSRWTLNQLNDLERREREAIAKELELDYWTCDPYIRAKTIYDRTGYIDGGGAYNPRPFKS